MHNNNVGSSRWPENIELLRKNKFCCKKKQFIGVTLYWSGVKAYYLLVFHRSLSWENAAVNTWFPPNGESCRNSPFEFCLGEEARALDLWSLISFVLLFVAQFITGMEVGKVVCWNSEWKKLPIFARNCQFLPSWVRLEFGLFWR